MRNFFKFNLTGKKLLPIWIIYMVLFLIPYIFLQFKIQTFSHQPAISEAGAAMQKFSSILQLYGFMFLLIIVQYAILFYVIKLSIDGIEYNEKISSFVGKFGKFLMILIPGFLLTIITLGIYGPWLYTRVIKFFASNSFNDSNNLEFKGKGSDLFVIILLTLIIPMLILIFAIVIIAFISGVKNGANPSDAKASPYAFLMMLLIFILFIPYMYYLYKWIINFRFKNYDIVLVTGFWNFTGIVALQILLSIITMGIYAPVASLKIYKFFAESTFATSETANKRFGYNIEPTKDFLFIWGQSLLSLITLGIYFPWAFCKITSRILEKSFTEEIEIAQ